MGDFGERMGDGGKLDVGVTAASADDALAEAALLAVGRFWADGWLRRDGGLLWSGLGLFGETGLVGKY